MAERLQKILSSHGVASRRAAEELIRRGEVFVNGVQAAVGDSADPERDEILVSGRPLPGRAVHVYIALYKPRGYITTAADERGRKIVTELLQGVGQRVYPVGRLDMDSEGLLLLTNDGAFANRVMHPSSEKEKTYIVKVKGNVADAATRLSEPVELDGYWTRPARTRLLREDGDTATISVVIHEGRNRQIRRMCQAAGLKVLRLKRTAIGGLTLSGLKAGQWRYLKQEDLEKIFR